MPGEGVWPGGAGGRIVPDPPLLLLFVEPPELLLLLVMLLEDGVTEELVTSLLLVIVEPAGQIMTRQLHRHDTGLRKTLIRNSKLHCIANQAEADRQIT